MGLLTRRRLPARRPPAVPAPVESATPEPAVELPEREVIRAADLDDTPGWATLPPVQPLLPTISLTASRHFDDDLVSWQAPYQALAPLGHSVSAAGPAGVVEVVTLLAVPLSPESSEGPAPTPELALVMPVASPPDAGPPEGDIARPISRRTGVPEGTRPTSPPVDLPQQPAPPRQPVSPRQAAPPRQMDLPLARRPEQAAGSTPPSAPTPGAPDRPPLPNDPHVPVVARHDPPAEPPSPTRTIEVEGAASQGEPEAALIGQTQLVAAPVEARRPEPVKPLVEAPIPPGLPLVQLPTARLPEGARRASPLAADVGVAPFVSHRTPRALTTPPAPAGPEVAAGPPTAAYPAASAGPPPAEKPRGPEDSSAPAVGLIGGQSLVAPLPESLAPDQEGVDPVVPPLPLVVTERPGTGRTVSPASGYDVAAEPGRTAGEAPTSSPPQAAPAAQVGSPSGVAALDPPHGAPPPSATVPLIGQAPLVPGLPSRGDEPASPPTEPTDPRAYQDLPVNRQGPPATGPGRPAHRGGLGAPIAGVPSTASSFNPTAGGRRPSMGEAIRAQLARTVSPGRPATSPAPPGRPGSEAAYGAEPPSAGPLSVGSVAAPPFPSPRLTLVGIERFEPEQGAGAPMPLRSGLAAPGAPVIPITPLQPFLVNRGLGASAPPPASPPREGAAVRRTVGQRHGVNLSSVPVDRSVAGAVQAQRLESRGFTGPTGVVIPAEVGSLDAGPGQALLAHELTHVAQRARLGANLPAEHTPAGQGLEAEAVSAELALAPSPATAWAGPGVGSQSTAHRVPARGTHPASDPPGSLPLAGPSARSGGTDAALVAAAQRLSQMGTSGAANGGSSTVVFTSPAASAAPTPAAAGVQRAALAPPMPPPAAPSETESNTSLFATRPSDTDLSKLARWIYPLISYRIRGELRENRERAGLLTDTYRRW